MIDEALKEQISWYDTDKTIAKDEIGNYEKYIKYLYNDRIKQIDKDIYLDDRLIDMNIDVTKIAEQMFTDIQIRKKTYIKMVIKSIANSNLEITTKNKTDNCAEKDQIILENIFNTINEDNTIPKSEWEQYTEWRTNDAIWNVDKDGNKTSINKCIANIIGFIEHFPKTKYKIKFNKVKNQVEWNNRQMIDSDIHTVLNLVNKYFINDFSTIKMIKEALDNVAFKNSFNPWIEYFDKLQYIDDGIDYIDYTIKNVLCCEEQEIYYDLYYETLKIFYLATMHRIYQKEKHIPVKFDIVTTICSRLGGSGKGTFFERLFDIEGNGNSYCYIVDSDSFNPSSKDFLEASHQCVCLLLDELKMNRSIITAVKGYITKQTDKFRKAFGYVNEDHIRGFTIVAASNNDDILKDYTTDNERRWAIVKISNDSNNYKNVNDAFDNGFRDKLWAFIKHIYETEQFKLYLTDSRLLQLEENIQREYKASNNADYNSIINDFLERDYGFYTIGNQIYIDSDYIVQQYKHNNSFDWCIRHNEEMNEKMKRAKEGKASIVPSDKMITKFGKINRIKKSQLYEILNKIGFEWTKPTLNAELRYCGNWKGLEKGRNMCYINGKYENSYWRVEEYELKDMVDDISSVTKEELPF